MFRPVEVESFRSQQCRWRSRLHSKRCLRVVKLFLTQYSSLGSFLFLDKIPVWPFFGSRQYCTSVWTLQTLTCVFWWEHLFTLATIVNPHFSMLHSTYSKFLRISIHRPLFCCPVCVCVFPLCTPPPPSLSLSLSLLPLSLHMCLDSSPVLQCISAHEQPRRWAEWWSWPWWATIARPGWWSSLVIWAPGCCCCCCSSVALFHFSF